MEVRNARRWRYPLETSFQQGNSSGRMREDSSRWPGNVSELSIRKGGSARAAVQHHGPSIARQSGNKEGELQAIHTDC